MSENLRIPCPGAEPVHATLHGGGRPEGVLVVHGILCFRDMAELRTLAEALSARRDVLAIDTRGHGDDLGRFTWGREEWRQVAATGRFGAYQEVRPTTPWNYGLLEAAVMGPSEGFRAIRAEGVGNYPWTLEGVPLEIRTRGRRMPEWQLYGNRAGPLPHSRPSEHLKDEPAEEIRLVPYGATRLGITEFPVVK